MKILKIPENTNDLRDQNVFINAVREFNLFQKNIQEYCLKIVEDEYLKDIEDWEKIVSENERDQLSTITTLKCFYNYETNTFVQNYHGHCSLSKGGWTMGAEKNHKTIFELSDDGTKIIVVNKWKSQEARFGHIPFHSASQKYEINLIKKSVKEL